MKLGKYRFVTNLEADDFKLAMRSAAGVTRKPDKG